MSSFTNRNFAPPRPADAPRWAAWRASDRLEAFESRMRDAYAGSAYSLAAHGATVGDLAVAIAGRVWGAELTAESAELIRHAGFLHDIGKTLVAAEIRLATHVFDADERRRMETHVTHGARLLKEADAPEEIAQAALLHHAWFGGGGYPGGGPVGDALPVTARIVHIADYYMASIEVRPYRPCPLAHATVVADMRTQNAAGRFDPRLFSAFLDCVETHRTAAAAVTEGINR
jgi:putative nucleotidyltransferase with HDIG domain